MVGRAMKHPLFLFCTVSLSLFQSVCSHVVSSPKEVNFKKSSAPLTTAFQLAQSPQVGTFNYAEALQKSFLFYEAQRSGPLPDDNRIPWRGDSALTDGQDVGRDLTGGYYDAGDHVKFGLPMAASMTMLAWGVEEYRSTYQNIGQLDEALDAIKWGTDYILKAYDDKGTASTADDVFYGQVGNGQADHAFWGPPETMTMERPTYYIDAQNPGSELAGESAAALAAASIVFRPTDTAYANQLLDQAQKLFDFAETYRGNYSDSIQDAVAFYKSWTGYADELAWSAAWLHKATQAAGLSSQDYLSKAENFFQETGGIANDPWTQNWDNKKHGTAILLAQETGDANYQSEVEAWLDRWQVDKQNGGIPEYTDGGLAWLDQWGSLRYSANTAMLAGIYADTVNDKGGQYSEFVQTQINYMLGDNPNNRSYVVGFGQNSPQNPHHRGAHGSTTNNMHQGETKNVLYGALVGGPSQPDDNAWADKRDDYIANEVALDYNAGFTGALAYMVDKFGGAPLPDSEIPRLFGGSTAPVLVAPRPVAPAPVKATPGIASLKDASGVDFSVVNDWGSGFQGEIVITNQGDRQMNGWSLEFDFANEITQIWNAEIVSHTGNTYVIRDAGWNSEIAPNGSISFGFIGEGSGSTEPRNFGLNGQSVETLALGPTPIDATPVDTTPVSSDGKVFKIDTGGADITNFNPAADKIDVGGVSVHNFIIVDTPEGVGFRDIWQNKTQIISGIALKDLSADNFLPIANDHLREDIGGALTWERGEAQLIPNTVYVRSHEEGLRETVDFSPVTDKISFLFYGSREQLNIQDAPEGIELSNTGTGQSIVLKGAKIADLTARNFEFHHSQVKEDNLISRNMHLDIQISDDQIVNRDGIAIPGRVGRNYNLPSYRSPTDH